LARSLSVMAVWVPVESTFTLTISPSATRVVSGLRILKFQLM
jgi:hypothetical protein